MTSLDDLRAQVGVARFAEAQRWAWQTAANTGRVLSTDEKDEWPEDIANVPHDVADAIWFDDQLSPLERVDLHFALYRVMPCYANLMYADLSRLDGTSLDMFWLHVRELLSHEDIRLADPVAYWLWCGPFEDPGESAEAWNRVVSGKASGGRGLARALAASGPVPWKAKAPLLRELLPDPLWHKAIFACIQASTYDVFGDLDASEAKTMLARLKLSGEAAESAASLGKELAARGVP